MNESDLPPLAQTLYQSCQATSALFREPRQPAGISVKDTSDVRTIVSRADTDLERLLMNTLRSGLGCGFVSEEQGLVDIDREYIAVIDPLDGSLNYLRQAWGLHGISIGLVKGTQVVAGAIHIPEHNTTLLAQAGRGAFVARGPSDIERIGPVGRTRALQDTRIIAGRGSAPPDVLLKPPLSKLIPLCAEIVNYASCCVGLASIALGKVDALVLPSQARWDFLGGYCILKEAGCAIEARTPSWSHAVGEWSVGRPADPFAHFDVIAASSDRLMGQIRFVMGIDS